MALRQYQLSLGSSRVNHPQSIPFADALALVRRLGSDLRLGADRIALRQAQGRVLRQSIVAPMSLPAFDNSAMDGFALRATDLAIAEEAGLLLVGSQFAGDGAPRAIGPGECLRITTGAAMPPGADTVAIKEHATIVEGRVKLAPGTTAGSHVRLAGSDVNCGDLLFDGGSTLGSVALGLLAALGIGEVEVASLPSVAVFTTGNELCPVGSVLGPGQIYDSNRVLLQALLAEEGIATLAWPALPDDEARLNAALSDATQAYDLILTCGGVSAGEKDLLPALLARHGRIHFWKVLMRPGMPVLFGQWGRSLVLGLPGNPVSVLATFRRLALPLLDALQGRTDRPAALHARLRSPVTKSHARLEFRRALLSCDEQGCLGVVPHPAAGSHQQRGAAESNAMLVLPESVRALEPGDLVEVEPYGAILRR
jgi:molybdopterin molybdotransferase